jgi:predicted nucleotidyltransferase
MVTIEQIRSTISRERKYLSERYHVGSLELFGSHSRGEPNEDSDIDLLVEFTDTIDLFDFIGLEQYLSDVLGKKVDLVMKGSIKPQLRERILREAVKV